MNFLVRNTCSVRRLHGAAGPWIAHIRSVHPARGAERTAVCRGISSTPAVSGGVSKVPGSDAKATWSEDVLQADSSPDILSGDVLQVVSEAGQSSQDLASLGLGALYTPVGLVQVLLDSLHTTTGMPWWGTIMVATVMLRVCLFPLSIKFSKNAAKMAKIQPELREIMKRAQHYAKTGATEQQQKEMVKVAELYKSHDCSPLTMMTLPFMQLPFFMSFFIGLRKMALAPLESMKTGGMLWFNDLTVPDATYALPLIACGLFVMNIQVYIVRVCVCVCVRACECFPPVVGRRSGRDECNGGEGEEDSHCSLHLYHPHNHLLPYRKNICV